jgi:hypothetical protein
VKRAKLLAKDPEVLNNITMEMTSASYKMKYGLARTMRQRTIEMMKMNKFSLNLDEATNVSGVKVVSVLVKYMEEGRLRCEHLVSLPLIKADSDSIVNALTGFFKDQKIPWKNCTSILCDSCAVMRGKRSGVETVLRRDHADHLLDIDGDVCHHLHNAVKKFCTPFGGASESLLNDLYNEFHWSSSNRDLLQQICFLVGDKYTVPQQYVAHRWLSCYDVALTTQLQLSALTIYAAAYLPREDKKLYENLIVYLQT